MAVGKIDLTAALRDLKEPGNRPSAQRKVRAEALSLVQEEELVALVYGYRIVPLRNTFDEVLNLEQGRLRAPGMVDFACGVSSIAAAVCSLGQALEDRVSSLLSRRRFSLALALDEVGSALLFSAARHVTLMVGAEVERQGLSTGVELSPGDAGFPLDQQAMVVALSGGERVGVGVNAQGMLFPVKSLSMVIGIGDRNQLHQHAPRRCDNCSSRQVCRFRMH